MQALTILLQALALLLIVATLLPLVRKEAWWIRVLDFPRVQIAGAGGAVVLLALALVPVRGPFETALLALLLLSVLYQVYRMFPYTPFAAVQVQAAAGRNPGVACGVFISNVLMSNRNVEGYLALVRGEAPDLILAAETDAWWEERLRVLEGDYPHTVKYPLANTYGMLLYSRLRLVAPEVKFLVEPDVPSIHTGVELASGVLVELHCLHPRPPHPVTSKDTVERDAELLLVAKSVKETDRPVIVAGDLNDVAWSHTTTLFQKISRLLDPRIGRGFYNTYNAKYPVFRYPLDHLFHSAHFRLLSLKRLGPFGSDHFPISVVLSYEPEAKELHKAPPPPTKKSLQEAHEKIEKAR